MAHIFSFSGIGSASRNTTYWLEADKIWCGCFTGTMQEFIDQIEETHGRTSRHALEYKAGIDFLNNCIAQIPSHEIEAGKKAYAEMMAKPEPVEVTV
jgi:hypothetical protein